MSEQKSEGELHAPSESPTYAEAIAKPQMAARKFAKIAFEGSKLGLP